MALSKIRSDSMTDTAIQSNRNFLINGEHKISQRGTSFTGLGGSSSPYVTDRWYCFNGGSSAGRFTVTQEAITDLSGFTTALKLDCTTADTSIGADEQLSIIQAIEAQNLQSLGFGTSGAKPLVFSFYAKANATKTYVAELYKEDSTTSSQSHTFTVTSSWQRFEILFNNTNADSIGDIDNNNGTGIYCVINLHAGSNLTSGTINSTWLAATQANRMPGCQSFFDSTDNTFFMTGAQLEIGEVATPFEHDADIGTTLLKCQRYFCKTSTTGLISPYGAPYNFVNWQYPVEMRATPTLGGGVQGTADNLNNVNATYYNTGNNYAKFGDGSNAATASAEI